MSARSVSQASSVMSARSGVMETKPAATAARSVPGAAESSGYRSSSHQYGTPRGSWPTVFALETYWPTGDGSAARIEKEVVVTADGCEVITKFRPRNS
jgi:hypothetical protein